MNTLKRVGVFVVGALVILVGCAPRSQAADVGIGCRTVGYKLNVAAVNDPQRVMALRVAVTMVSIRTHNRYRFDGYTSEIPTADNATTLSDDLIIAVVDPADAGFVNGLHGANLFSVAQVENGRADMPSAFEYSADNLAHVAIMFDALNFNVLPSGLDFDTHLSDFVIAEHELGHSVGLSHSDNIADIMSGTKPTTSIWYTADDAVRLESAGCPPPSN